MSEPIRWQQLTPEQRNALIAEKVMRWQGKPCDGEWAELSGGWFCTKCGYDGNWGDGFAHTELPPRYTQSMDAVWPVLLSAAYHTPSEKSSSLQKLAHELFNCGMIDDLHDLNPYWVLGLMQGWTPEFLCIACLRACGYEVINERS